MYQFSRSIYRELADRVIVDRCGDATASRQEILEACERTVQRLAFDGRYFARPARTLFEDVRMHFPLSEQLRVFMVIDRNIKLAREFLSQLPPGALSLDGVPTQCRATTRKGSACQRQPLPGRDYCPSHQHLEETFEEVGELEQAAAA